MHHCAVAKHAPDTSSAIATQSSVALEPSDVPLCTGHHVHDLVQLPDGRLDAVAGKAGALGVGDPGHRVGAGV